MFGTIKRSFVILFAMLIVFSLSLFTQLRASGLNNWLPKESVSFRYYVDVYVGDVDYRNARASVSLYVHILDCNYPNVTSITVIFEGDAYILVRCTRLSKGEYSGFSETVQWPLQGKGELYPFDDYFLRFVIASGFYFHKDDGIEYLHPNATIDESLLLRNIELLTPASEFENARFIVRIQRNSILPFLQMVLPTIFCFFVLGGSMLIHREKLSSRLTVYLSLFVFAPTFLIAIQPFLPYRNSLSIVEILLVSNLAIDAVFTFTSMIPSRVSWGRKIDFATTLFSTFLFGLFYGSIFQALTNTYVITIFMTCEIGLLSWLIVILISQKLSKYFND